MKKLLGVFLAFLVFAQMSLALNSYFFLTSTSGQGTIDDPAYAICMKYGIGKNKITYGNLMGVCAIEYGDTTPDVTEIIQPLTRQQVVDLHRVNMPNFNGLKYIYDWENPTP